MQPVHNNIPAGNRGAFDLEASTPAPVKKGWGCKQYTALAVGAGIVGGGIAGLVLATQHKNHSPAPVPTPTPAPTQTPVAQRPILTPPPPPPVATPAPNNNITGFLNVLPFSMQKKTAMYLQQPVAGGQKFAVVLADADENCQTLTAGPVRGSGVQELDFCQVMNSTQVVAQNGRIIQNGLQYPSTAMSLTGNVDSNGVLNAHFTMNTTNVGFVSGDFSAQPCNTLQYINFCNLQD